MSNFTCYLKFVLGYVLAKDCFCHNFINTANFTRRQLARGTLTLMIGVDGLCLNKMGQLLYLVQVTQKKIKYMQLYLLCRKPLHSLNEHDLILVQEVLLFESWRYCQGSIERGNVWKSMAETLNAIEQPLFKVNKYSTRD